MSVECRVKITCEQNVVILMFLFVVKNEVATSIKKLHRKITVFVHVFFQKLICFCINKTFDFSGEN
jgi:hypothetical protein